MQISVVCGPRGCKGPRVVWTWSTGAGRGILLDWHISENSEEHGMAKEPTLTVEEILKRALAKERAAFGYYDRLLKSTKIELIQDLLQELKNEEYRHIKLIEDKIHRLDLG